jgi:hypothetical protein
MASEEKLLAPMAAPSRWPRRRPYRAARAYDGHADGHSSRPSRRRTHHLRCKMTFSKEAVFEEPNECYKDIIRKQI